MSALDKYLAVGDYAVITGPVFGMEVEYTYAMCGVCGRQGDPKIKHKKNCWAGKLKAQKDTAKL